MSTEAISLVHVDLTRTDTFTQIPVNIHLLIDTLKFIATSK